MIRKGDIFYFGYDSCCLDLLCHCSSSALVIQEAQVGQGFQPTGGFPPRVGGFHFPTPGMEQIFSTKVRRPEEQLENSVTWGRHVLRALWWASLDGSQMGMELTSRPIAFPSKTWSTSIKFFPPSMAKPTSSLALMTAVVSQWAVHYAEARITSFESKSDLVTLLLTSLLWLPIALSPKFKCLTLTRLCMIGPLLLAPALSQVPLLFLPLWLLFRARHTELFTAMTTWHIFSVCLGFWVLPIVFP